MLLMSVVDLSAVKGFIVNLLNQIVNVAIFCIFFFLLVLTLEMLSSRKMRRDIKQFNMTIQSMLFCGEVSMKETLPSH